MFLILHELSFKFGFILADLTNWFNFVNFDQVQSFVVKCFLNLQWQAMVIQFASFKNSIDCPLEFREACILRKSWCILIL